jgi:glycosyltransferase involved in cell wall biosynthesis
MITGGTGRKNEAPLVSIITVVFNGEKVIPRTIDSIRKQAWKNFEYIVIDGNSKDNTLDILRLNEDIITYWQSEPDKGLYDAMNKGLKTAKGYYVCFLNAGDQLYDENTLKNIFEGLNPLPDVVYGETMIVDAEGKEIGLRRLKAPEKLTWRSFINGMLVCHQSIYVKRELADSYNLKYKIAADYEWVLKALKKAKNIHNSRLVVTRFLDGGINKKNIRRGLSERLRIMIKHYGLFLTAFNHLVIGVKFFWFLFRNKRF